MGEPNGKHSTGAMNTELRMMYREFLTKLSLGRLIMSDCQSLENELNFNTEG